MTRVRFQDIEAAARRLAGHVLDTPCVESKTLGEIIGAQVFLKFENLQFTASFKERGALNKLSTLLASGVTPKGRDRGFGRATMRKASRITPSAWGLRR